MLGLIPYVLFFSLAQTIISNPIVSLVDQTLKTPTNNTSLGALFPIPHSRIVLNVKPRAPLKDFKEDDVYWFLTEAIKEARAEVDKTGNVNLPIWHAPNDMEVMDFRLHGMRLMVYTAEKRDLSWGELWDIMHGLLLYMHPCHRCYEITFKATTPADGMLCDGVLRYDKHPTPAVDTA